VFRYEILFRNGIEDYEEVASTWWQALQWAQEGTTGV
jgi:hypothetical protein